MADTKKLYARRDVEKQGDYYFAHVMAMTGESLHSKTDIAAELAYRDILIAELQDRVGYLETELETEDI